jgi:hypothetical protein
VEDEPHRCESKEIDGEEGTRRDKETEAIVEEMRSVYGEARAFLSFFSIRFWESRPQDQTERGGARGGCASPELWP